MFTHLKMFMNSKKFTIFDPLLANSNDKRMYDEMMQFDGFDKSFFTKRFCN